MNENDKRNVRLDKLAAEEREPDTSDIPERSEEEWAKAEVGKFFRQPANRPTR